MAKDPAILAHQEWLGYVQPTGLVVSIPALIDASAFLNRNYGPDHQRFLSALPQDGDGEPIPEFPSFVRFAQDVLGWDTALLVGAGTDPVPAELEVNLENYNETLRPTYALRNLNGESKWLLLVDVLPTGTNLEQVYAPHDRGWQASPQARFERLLRQTGVSTGLLVNGREIRLVYAPEKELSGHITFKLTEMVQVAGRPIFAALQMLLGSERLYSVADKERLPAILSNSRKYQNVVSTKLAEQVLEALYELLRGFQAANDQMKGELLRDVLAQDPDHVYHGLLTTLLRLVFVLYAEDRGLLSTDPIYSNYYSIRGLYERLRADAGRYTDTMDQRYGAWAQLLALFRLIYSGGSHGGMKIPAREGYLFDPDRYLFLEGRHEKKDKPVIPRASDGVVYRVLSKLLLLDGERLSYRTLAVEQIGSVYEAIMGFELQVAAGKSIAIKPPKKHGAPATINLEELLRTASDKRLKWFTETTDQKLTGQAADTLKTATTIEELLVVLDRKIAKAVTPNIVPQGAMIFQPSNERRKSGSHYTPSTLTGPIVEAALAPVLKQLGDNPKPEQILNLKVCDPAMGSGAFLVEASRQLGDGLMKAWHAHNALPVLPPDEEEALHSQRIVAQRCLYGVDKNPMAVDLAKLSLWLATLAKDHPFTFLDHSLRHGDSLVGLTRQQIAAFHWGPAQQQSILEDVIRKRIDLVSRFRRQILEARDDTPYATLKQKLDGADESLGLPRRIGDSVVSSFFSAGKPRNRENARLAQRQLAEAILKDVTDTRSADALEVSLAKLKRGTRGIAPFHWELEFPEVFSSDGDAVTGGFDVIIGNPPFAGKNTLAKAAAPYYIDWLQAIYEHSHGSSDLVAYFFRRSFNLLRPGGCFGLIATNTIGQGDTRSTGLRWICTHCGTIYRVRKRLKWPGQAAVIVSVVHISKGPIAPPYLLDNREVPMVTAYLFHAGGNEDPFRLRENEKKAFKGAEPGSLGFLVTREQPQYSSFAEIKDPRDGKTPLLKPYVGGLDLNEGGSTRFVLDVDSLTVEQMASVPHVLAYLEAHVRTDFLRRGEIKEDTAQWWNFRRPTLGMYEALKNLSHAIVCSRHGDSFAFARLATGQVFSESMVVIASGDFTMFAALQCRVHEIWARFQGSSIKDDLRYTPSDCFQTFPFPPAMEANVRLEQAGRTYLETRARVMQDQQLCLTPLYNLFHDPDCENVEVLKIRDLHASMDQVMIESYGWPNIHPKCEFIREFDDEEDEVENGRPKKKKYRYRWTDEIRDEVLARLLELNWQRALEKGQPVAGDPTLGPNPSNTNKKKSKAKKAKQGSAAGQFTINLGEA